MEENQRSRRILDQIRSADVGNRVEEGLEIETGFEVWVEYVRQQAGDSRVGGLQFVSDSDRIEAIVQEEIILKKLAFTWDAGSFFGRLAQETEDITKGSEHYVIRHVDGSGNQRVLKATYPGKYGRYEYTPTIYLNSLRLVQKLVPALDIRIHGIISWGEVPSIVTSMRYISGRHPRPAEIASYLKNMGWAEYHDGSQTLDFVNEANGQIIRDGHPNNWVREKGSGLMVPIDISIEAIGI